MSNKRVEKAGKRIFALFSVVLILGATYIVPFYKSIAGNYHILTKNYVIKAQTDKESLAQDLTPDAAGDTEPAKNPDDLCANKEGWLSQLACRAKAKIKLAAQDAMGNITEYANNMIFGGLVNTALAHIYPIGVDENGEIKVAQDSEYWRKVAASVSPIDRLGVLGFTVLGTELAMLVNPTPLDTTAVIYAKNFLPKQVRDEISNAIYAQTRNFKTLGNPPSSKDAFVILSEFVGTIWMEFFKLATGAFVIVLIIAGLFIIFRKKAGQSVVTVYMAIKNLIFGYIGAFFSFAFGAFFFNLSKWLILVMANLIINVYTSIGDGVPGYIVFPDASIVGAGYFGWLSWRGYYNSLFGGGGAGYLGIGVNAVLAIIAAVVAASGPAGIGAVAGAAIVLSLVMLIFGVAAITIFLKIFIKVAKVYIMMVFDIILAPWIFLIGALPGSEKVISDWFIRMFKNAIVVPAMFLVINLAMLTTFTFTSGLYKWSGGAFDSGTGGFLALLFGVNQIFGLVILATSLSIDDWLTQVFGGASKGASVLSQGAKKALKSTIVGGIIPG